MENPPKVQAMLTELNKGHSSRPWIAVDGFNVMPEALLNPAGGYVITSKGYNVKIFINTDTGEIKLFPASLFTF